MRFSIYDKIIAKELMLKELDKIVEQTDNQAVKHLVEKEADKLNYSLGQLRGDW